MNCPLLYEFAALGVQVTAQGHDLVIRPASRVPEALKQRLKVLKAEVLAVLRSPASPEKCRHCNGRGECSCPACNLRRTAASAPCLICQPDRRRFWLAASRKESCWHCNDAGRCGCFLCGNPQTGEGGFCIVCGRSDRVRLQ
jgi:hypothetical protein